MRTVKLLCAIVFFFCFLGINIIAATIHVPGDQPTIQAGIDAAVNGDTVLVADGIYTGIGNRDINFSGKAITVMSENGADNCVIDCGGSDEDRHRGFYFNNDELEDSVMEGFTIRNGYEQQGGGIYCETSTPSISACKIIGNTGVYGGGAIYCTDASAPTIESCKFSGNSAGSGGAIACFQESFVILSNCSISGNRTTHGGGGIYSHSSSLFLYNCSVAGNTTHLSGAGIQCFNAPLNLINCTFSGNVADQEGGAIDTHGATLDIHNCLITENLANLAGGGIYCFGTSPSITNCTITGNVADYYSGGAIYCYYYSSPSLNNCILWNNTPDEITAITGTPVISYSCIQGGYEGTGNIDVNPLFVSGNLGDYFLSQIPAGQLQNSPCVNAGSDLAENICFDTSANEICMNELWTRTDEMTDSEQVDMGVHYPIPSIPPCIHHGDVTFNGEITSDDAQLSFQISLGVYSPCYEERCSADCNGDDEVTAGDAQSVFEAMLGTGYCIDPL